MLESSVVEVDGVFVGAAILHARTMRCSFFATHERVRALHGCTMPDLDAVRRRAAEQFRAAGRPHPQAAGLQTMPPPPPARFGRLPAQACR
ncbi:hypothetical protein [Lichenicoccus roseus]|uniref:Uncharacterized protein n=1 Tax=Lichenicoccus roseus TaxID=2683649 RepID=A0A5R9J9L7_9PROT|nr:hypothetical protein [Lichenicoccus roseus]TLU74275.1 hypothetical protein FE263_03520 [Lichenicoccus roseus]